MIGRIICVILAICIVAFCVFMVIGTVRHIREGLPEAIGSAFNDICDWIAGIFGIKTSHADVILPMANANIEWVNTRISW